MFKNWSSHQRRERRFGFGSFRFLGGSGSGLTRRLRPVYSGRAIIRLRSFSASSRPRHGAPKWKLFRAREASPPLTDAPSLALHYSILPPRKSRRIIIARCPSSRLKFWRRCCTTIWSLEGSVSHPVETLRIPEPLIEVFRYKVALYRAAVILMRLIAESSEESKFVDVQTAYETILLLRSHAGKVQSNHMA